MKKKLGKAAILTGSMLLALLIAEISVRGLDILPRPLDPLPVPSYRLSANPVIAYEFRPGYKPSDAPFDYTHYGYSINSAGFRDQEHQKAKPDGTYRIVVLGDSTTAGNGVPVFESLYTERLEKLLNQNVSISCLIWESVATTPCKRSRR